ncbi:MAG: SPOR domain-containing protein [Gemmatimonadaceae bacterium]
MRRRLSIPLLLLSALACGRDQRASTDSMGDAARAEASRGPDPILIRIPRNGGTVNAYLYPRLDSTVWTGRATSVDRVLGFDPEGGALAVVDSKGQPARVDLRGASPTIASKAKLASLATPNGVEIYGIDAAGAVERLTRGGDWSFTPPLPAKGVFPQTDGSIVIAAQRGKEAVLWLVHPPDTKIRDSVALPITIGSLTAQVGDRVYFATDTALVGVRSRDLSEVPAIKVRGPVVALAPTPSGDRIYVAMENDSSLAVVDRYTDRISTSIGLPGKISALRMDGLGRYVLVRPIRGDSAWVVAVATNHVVGTVQTKWTGDLPATAPDGAIALYSGRDVIFVDGETLQAVRTVAGGASDFWYFTFWNGFRARAAGVDEPVSFAMPDSASPDSAGAAADAKTRAAVDSVTRPVQSVPAPVTAPHPQPARPVPPTPPVIPAPTASASSPFTVSFAALLNAEKAHVLADSIVVAGTHARVVPSQRAGTTVYRVVLGPFPNRAAAEQVGRDSKRSYWVFPGQP